VLQTYFGIEMARLKN